MIVNFKWRSTGALPDAVIDRAGVIAFANDVRAVIVRRTLRGVSATGRPFKPYSTRPMTVSLSSGVALRLWPRGGEKSESGDSVHYEGGYAEYKRESRQYTGSEEGATAEVDLTLSGQMLRGIHVAMATDKGAVLQTGDSSADYAWAVQDVRPFMGIAPSERELVERLLAAQVARYLGLRGGERR